MKHTRIVVRIGRTQNLENYSNARPEIEIEGVLEEGDDPEACKAQLRAEARAFVEEEVDAALEAENIPAKFWKGSRFQVYETQEVWLGAFRRQFRLPPPERLVIIVPEGVPLGERGEGKRWYSQLYRDSGRAMRLDHARQRAREHIADHPERGYRLVDCADGDLAAIPAWVAQLPEARHTVQELAACRALDWYEDHLGLGTRARVVECHYDPQDDGWLVELWAEGVEGARLVYVSSDAPTRFADRPVAVPVFDPADAGERDDDEGGEDDDDKL